MLVCDNSGLLAYFDASDAHSAEVSGVIDADPGPFIVSPYVVAEPDYLLAARRGVHAELAALAELSGGARELPAIEVTDLREASPVIDRYQDQNIGVADHSSVVLARRYRTDRLLTLDHRHSRVIRTAGGKPFTAPNDLVQKGPWTERPAVHGGLARLGALAVKEEVGEPGGSQ